MTFLHLMTHSDDYSDEELKYSPCLYPTPARNSSRRCLSSLLSRSLREETTSSEKTFQRSVSTESFAATQSLLSRLFVYMTVKSACWHLTKPLRTNIQL